LTQLKHFLTSLVPGRRAPSTWVDENGLPIVKVFAQNDSQEMRAYLQAYEGRLLAHLRLFVRDRQGVGRPTKKGLALEACDLPGVEEAVRALIAATRRQS
jgi:hypothetical protein